jgi:hypothetical protein
VGRYVATDPRISVLAPAAAEIVALLRDQDVLCALPFGFKGGQHPGKARTDDDQINGFRRHGMAGLCNCLTQHRQLLPKR